MPSLAEVELKYQPSPEESSLLEESQKKHDRYETWIRDRILRFSREVASAIQQHGLKAYVMLKPWAFVLEVTPERRLFVHFQDGDRVFFDRHLGSMSQCVGRDVHGSFAALVAVMMALKLREGT